MVFWKFTPKIYFSQIVGLSQAVLNSPIEINQRLFNFSEGLCIVKKVKVLKRLSKAMFNFTLK